MRPVPVAGSKLVLDPYWYLGPEIFSDLARMIEPHVRLIHLRRSYLDAWLSWKVRGVYHRVDPERAAQLKIGADELPNIPEPETARLLLTHRGQPLAQAEGAHYPLAAVIDDMLAAFVNDLQLADLTRTRDGLAIDYAEIPARFAEVARFVGSTAADWVFERVLQRPLTLKLDGLAEHVSPIDPPGAVSAVLEAAIAGPAPAWRFENSGTLHLELPSLAALLRDWSLTEYVDGDTIRWPLRKPLLTV